MKAMSVMYIFTKDARQKKLSGDIRRYKKKTCVGGVYIRLCVDDNVEEGRLLKEGNLSLFIPSRDTPKSSDMEYCHS